MLRYVVILFMVTSCNQLGNIATTNREDPSIIDNTTNDDTIETEIDTTNDDSSGTDSTIDHTGGGSNDDNDEGNNSGTPSSVNAPTLTSIQVPQAGTYKALQPLNFVFVSSSPVTVTGAPQLLIDVGGQQKVASYASGSGTTSITFRYTIAVGDADADGITITSVNLNGGSIANSAGTLATSTLPTTNTSAVLVSAPEPSLAAVVPHEFKQTITSGNRLYILFKSGYDHGGIRIYDITNASSPTVLGNYYFEPRFVGYNIGLTGNTLVVSTAKSSTYQLEFIDVSDPSSPDLIVKKTLSQHAYGLAVSGSLAFVGYGPTGLDCFDFSDTNNIVLRDSLSPTTGSAYTIRNSGADKIITYQGNTTGTDLALISFADPDNLSEVATYEIDGTNGTFSESISAVETAGSYVYVLGSSNSSAFVSNRHLTVLNAADLTQVSRLVSNATINYANNMVISGNYAYVSDFSTGMRVFNISNPASVSFVSFFQTQFMRNPATGAVNTAKDSRAYYISASGSTVAVAGEVSLTLVDVTTPASPSKLYSECTVYYAKGVTVSGNYAYVAASSTLRGGLAVVDISAPTAPRCLHTYDIEGGLDVDMNSSTLAFVAENTGISLFDMANAPDILRVSSASIAQPYGALIDGNYLYVSAYSAGVKSYDISDSANPALLDTLDTDGWAYDAVKLGNNLFVAEGDRMTVINVADPSDMSVVATATGDLSWAERIALVGNKVLLADSGLGSVTFDVSNISSITQIEAYVPPYAGWGWGAFSHNGFGYLLSETITTYDSTLTNENEYSGVLSFDTVRAAAVYQDYLVFAGRSFGLAKDVPGIFSDN